MIEASLRPPIVQSSDEVNISSLVHDYEDFFDETVPPAMSWSNLE